MYCDPEAEVEVTVSLAKLRSTCTTGYARSSCVFAVLVVVSFVAVCAAVTLRSSRAGQTRQRDEERRRRRS